MASSAGGKQQPVTQTLPSVTTDWVPSPVLSTVFNGLTQLKTELCAPKDVGVL